MESIRKALDITTSLTTNNDARRAFQLMPTLESERFQTLVHSYRRPTLTRSVSDPSIVTTKISTHTLTETPIQHNNNSSPLRRFATMPPPSTTGRTPLAPNPNTVAIDSLRRTFNPIWATNLFPDETPGAETEKPRRRRRRAEEPRRGRRAEEPRRRRRLEELRRRRRTRSSTRS